VHITDVGLGECSNIYNLTNSQFSNFLERAESRSGLLGNLKQKCFWHDLIISMLLVLNNFIFFADDLFLGSLPASCRESEWNVSWLFRLTDRKRKWKRESWTERWRSKSLGDGRLDYCNSVTVTAAVHWPSQESVLLGMEIHRVSITMRVSGPDHLPLTKWGNWVCLAATC